MKRRFNITGSCSPKKHYMVSLDDRLRTIKGDFADESVFVRAFARAVIWAFDIMDVSSKEEFLQPLTELAEKTEDRSLAKLFLCLSRMCAKAPKPVVMMIDEVDSASNNQVFIDFLARRKKSMSIHRDIRCLSQ